MIVPKNFDHGTLYFEITKPFMPDASGQLVESNKWMVQIHKGSVAWFGGSVLLDMKTQKTALFDKPEDGLKAAIDFAHHCGLKDAP